MHLMNAEMNFLDGVGQSVILKQKLSMDIFVFIYEQKCRHGHVQFEITV